MEIDEFVSVCRRGYSGVFWSVFVREKCTRGRGEEGREGVSGWDR
jgi:hypothetical protein